MKIPLPISSYRVALSGLLILLSINASTHADVLTLPTKNVSTEINLDVPKRGQTSQEVLQQHGKPQTQKPAVGFPPISSWSYPTFSVYFESAHVIHSVVEK